MPALDAIFAEDATALQITAKISEGWGKKKKTYGFVEQDSIEFRGDRRVRVQLQVLPRPASLRDDLSHFPAGKLEGGNQNINYVLEDKLLKILVRLYSLTKEPNMDLPWIRTSNGKGAIHWREQVRVPSSPFYTYEFQLLVIFNDRPRGKPQDVRERDTPFWSGGLPSLGKQN